MQGRFSPRHCLYALVGDPGINVRAQVQLLAGKVGGLPLTEQLLPLHPQPVPIARDLLLELGPEVDRAKYWEQAHTLVQAALPLGPTVLTNPLSAPGDGNALFQLASKLSLHLCIAWIHASFDTTVRGMGTNVPFGFLSQWRTFMSVVAPQLSRPPLDGLVSQVAFDPRVEPEVLHGMVTAVLLI